MLGSPPGDAARTLRPVSVLIIPDSPSGSPDPRALAPLSDAELRAAALDGEIVSLGDAYLPIDAPALPGDRARSLAALRADPRLFAERRSAAWVHGWCAEPAAASVAVNVAARVPSGVRRRTGARELVIDDGELVFCGGVRVTSPLRTLLDLAREHDDDVSLDALTAIVAASSIPVATILASLTAARGAPYVTRARRRLLAVADAIDVVDRVDAAHRIQHSVEVGHVTHFEHELRDRQAVA